MALKLVRWVLLVCLAGIGFDSLLLMDDNTRFWVLVALVVVAVVALVLEVANWMASLETVREDDQQPRSG